MVWVRSVGTTYLAASLGSVIMSMYGLMHGINEWMIESAWGGYVRSHPVTTFCFIAVGMLSLILVDSAYLFLFTSVFMLSGVAGALSLDYFGFYHVSMVLYGLVGLAAVLNVGGVLHAGPRVVSVG